MKSSLLKIENRYLRMKLNENIVSGINISSFFEHVIEMFHRDIFNLHRKPILSKRFNVGLVFEFSSTYKIIEWF